MRLKKMFATTCVALITLAGLGNAPQAQASSLSSQGSSAIAGLMGVSKGVTVQQGDEILGFRGLVWSTCTLGYVDQKTRTGYTASHCAFPGEPIFNEKTQLIGFVEKSNYLELGAGATDVARIRFIDGVRVGHNVHTGDVRVHHAHVSPGEEVCSWGFKNKRVVCGQITDTRGENIYAHLPGTGVGDSGGPAWIPGRGFVGVISGGDNKHPNGVFRERIASPDGL